MDHTEARLHQEIIHTRQVIDDRLAHLERRTRQTVHGVRSTVTDVIDHSLMASVQRMQDTSDKGGAVLARYPWLILVGGALFGYFLGRTPGPRHRPVQVYGVRTYEITPQCLPATLP